MTSSTRAEFLRVGAGSFGMFVLAGCSSAPGISDLPRTIRNGSARKPMTTTVSNNVVTTSQSGMTLTTDLNTGLMTLSGYGISQTYQAPASGSVVIGQPSTFPDGTAYTATSNTTATFSNGSLTGNLSFTTDGTNYTSSHHEARYSAVNYGSSDTGTYARTPTSGGGGGRIVTPQRSGWHCGWAIFELGLGATGLAITAGAAIAGTGGLGAGLVIGLVAAHMGTLASMVDVGMSCM